ncbi:uncharacterized protein LOC115621317 isoform X2 [Scaptodrosophila lebanonensis]|uniref:Uncharacterized protein LOC115621317 isoform X2 n=1 Tax=Drosophila lebanonensis TaxID=7225 RepID=A0A6J2T697_DROLE|nr:uncharacterized protein LOC115621317 isoform X2 [Scaptodrosophila lebanonensis]
MKSIDIKEMLLLSSTVKRTMWFQKCIKMGKVSYAVRFELRGTELSVQHMKRINAPQKLANRLNRRRQRMCRLRKHCQILSEPKDSCCQTDTKLLADKETETIIMATSHNGTQTICMRTSDNETQTGMMEMQYKETQTEAIETRETQVQETSTVEVSVTSMDGCSQTPLIHYVHAKLDTQDLIFMNSQEQQTLIRHFTNSATQSEAPRLDTHAIQVQCEAKTRMTQTEHSSSSVGTQLEKNSQHSYAQTTQQESEPAGLQEVLYTIMASLNGQIELLHNGLESINQLVDLNMFWVLTNKRRKEAKLQFETEQGSKGDESMIQLQAQENHKQTKIVPLPKPELIGDLMQPDENNLQQQLVTKIMQYAKLKLNGHPAKRQKRKHRSRKSWNCTLKCKGCGLHMHRTKTATVKTECQYTQTDMEMKATNFDIGTQTDKERGFWTLKRNSTN